MPSERPTLPPIHSLHLPTLPRPANYPRPSPRPETPPRPEPTAAVTPRAPAIVREISSSSTVSTSSSTSILRTPSPATRLPLAAPPSTAHSNQSPRHGRPPRESRQRNPGISFNMDPVRSGLIAHLASTTYEKSGLIWAVRPLDPRDPRSVVTVQYTIHPIVKLLRELGLDLISSDAEIIVAQQAVHSQQHCDQEVVFGRNAWRQAQALQDEGYTIYPYKLSRIPRSLLVP